MPMYTNQFKYKINIRFQEVDQVKNADAIKSTVATALISVLEW